MFVRFLLPADPPDLPVPLPVLLLMAPIEFSTAERLRAAGWVRGNGAEFAETDTTLRFDSSGDSVSVAVGGARLFDESSADSSSFPAWESAVHQFGDEVLLVLTAPDTAASLLAGGEVDASALMRSGHGTFARVASAENHDVSP